MNRRSFLASAGGALAAAARRPNLVFILADDLGSSDLSSYGTPDISSPHIDSIGRQGVRFTRCYANAPECSPTRTALLTGRYQQRIGGLECAIGVGNVGRYDEAEWLASRHDLGLPAGEATLAHLLRRAGYDTCLSGKWHLGYEEKFLPTRHGFDESFGILGGGADYFSRREQDGTNVLYHNGRAVEKPGYTTDLFADHAIEWLSRRSPAKPFFLYLPFTAPHTPLQGPRDHAGMDAPRSESARRERYVQMVEHMDRRIGDVLAQLDKTGAASHTLVIFQSDNGGPVGQGATNHSLRGAKSLLWEGGIRIPCLMRWPGVIPPGTTTSQVAVTMDATATMLAAASAKPARPLDGIDLLPVLTGKRRPASRTLFWSYKRAANRRYAARDGDWKLVVENGVEFMFDLAADPGEQNNLLAARPAEATRLRAKLEAWKKDTAPARLREFFTARR